MAPRRGTREEKENETLFLKHGSDVRGQFLRRRSLRLGGGRGGGKSKFQKPEKGVKEMIKLFLGLYVGNHYGSLSFGGILKRDIT